MGFLEAGASVTILDRSMEAVEATVKELSSFDTDVHGMSVDVSSAAAVSDAMDELFEGASGTAGKPAADILCNVAGITRDGWLTRMSEENWDAVIDVNLKGTFLTTQAFARKRMALNEAALPSEGGVVKPAPASVINIGSIVGKIGNMGQANYSASKAGVVGFTKTAAKELAAHSIRVNCILPGFIATPMSAAVPEKVINKFIEVIPLKRMGEPDELANACLFLASERSSFMTGAIVEVSGGQDM